MSNINVPALALTYNWESRVVVHNLELYIFNIHEKSLKIYQRGNQNPYFEEQTTHDFSIGTKLDRNGGTVQA